MLMEVNEREKYWILRRRKGLEAKAIADSIGISQSLISKWERNTVDMSDSLLEKYKKFIEEYEV